jgi:hypothetical protein
LPGASGASINSANPDASWMTVLAALAHEVGHIHWATMLRKSIYYPYNPNVGYDFKPLIKCTAGDFFQYWAYDHNNSVHLHLQPRLGWRGFADRQNDYGQQIDHTISPTLMQLDTNNPMYIYQLYQANQPWASLFGAQTPDEDFVEAYTMAALTGYQVGATPGIYTFSGPLTSLPLTVNYGSTPPDVAADLRAGKKSPLTNKMSCIAY